MSMQLSNTQSNLGAAVKPVLSGKEQRFVAPNMPQALRKLTEAFGADAILLSSRKMGSEVEIIGLPPGEKSTLDDFSQLHSDRRRGERRSNGRRVSDLPESVPANDMLSSASSETDASKLAEAQDLAEAQQLTETFKSAHTLPESVNKQHTTASTDRVSKRALAGINLRQTAADLAKQIDGLNQRKPADKLKSQVDERLDAMQQLLERTLEKREQSTAAWMPPQEYVLRNRLRELRLSEKVISRLVSSVESSAQPGMAIDRAWQQVLSEFKNMLPVYQGDILTMGGVFALTGPSAVGKTSFALKLLARAALNEQADDVVLLSFDVDATGNLPGRVQRLASVSQIAVLPVTTQYNLQQRIVQCADKRVVLIDTGSAQRSVAYKAYLSALREFESQPDIREIVCLSATADVVYQRELLSRYCSSRTVACAVTHCDQVRLSGELASLLIEQKMPLSLMSWGEILPQQLVEANPEVIVDDLCGGNKGVQNDLADEVLMPIVNLPVDGVSARVMR